MSQPLETPPAPDGRPPASARRSHGRTRRTVVVGAALAGLLAGACAPAAAERPAAAGPSAPPVPSPGQASYSPAPCPSPIYGEGFDLGLEFSCGYLEVLENRSTPRSGTIRLAVAVRPATAPGPKPDPIVFLTGGPGGSGLAEGPGIAEAWHPDRDVIFLDQRGTLTSDPFLSCPEVDAFMERTVAMSWSAPETAEQSAAVTRACRDRLAGTGVDLAAYNTTESAADVADLRTAMGIDQWNIYGISYGTDLALQVLRDHPAGVRSVVVDAVLPPDINPMETGWRAAGESSKAIYDACAADPECHAAFPGGWAEYVRVLDDLAEGPRTVQLADPGSGAVTTVVIDAVKLAYTVQFATLLGSPPKVPALVHDLAVGDGTLAAAEILAGVLPPDFNSYGLQWGVLCREMVARTDPARVRAAAAQDLPEFPPAVTSTPAMFPWSFTDCASWGVPGAPAQVASGVTSDVPVLLASGAFDGTTPPSYAAHAARTLSIAQQVVFAGIGHGASRWSPACFATVMASFLDAPEERVDDRCVGTLAVSPFVTS